MIKLLQNRASGWILFLITLFTGYLVAVIEDFSSLFLVLLIAINIMVILSKQAFNPLVVTLARTIIGLIFIFSGFVKGVDPVGTQYRIEDYFIAFGTQWANPAASFLSIILNAWEFALGALFLFNIRIKLTSWLVLLTMAFFTFVTINDAMNNPVPDCGCFGDALLISNWQTFYKNLVINALLFIVFFNRNKVIKWFLPKIEISISLFIIVGFIAFEVYNIRHLPLLDFRNWKVGNKMVHENPLPEEYYLTFQNKITGETKEYLSPDYPYNDSVWAANWEFVSQRVVDPNPPLYDLNIIDSDGYDQTASIIENPSDQYLMIAEDLDKTRLHDMGKIRNFITACNERGVSFVIITSSLPETANLFLSENKLETEIYYADDIALKAMIRSNPGLVLLKDAVVVNKWHYNDWPEIDTLP